MGNNVTLQRQHILRAFHKRNDLETNFLMKENHIMMITRNEHTDRAKDAFMVMG